MIRFAALLLLAAALPAAADDRKTIADGDRCAMRYSLAPGERAVLNCQFKPRARIGVAQVQSGHASVDATLVAVAPIGVTVTVTNRSAEPIKARAVLEYF